MKLRNLLTIAASAISISAFGQRYMTNSVSVYEKAYGDKYTFVETLLM